MNDEKFKGKNAQTVWCSFTPRKNGIELGPRFSLTPQHGWVGDSTEQPSWQKLPVEEMQERAEHKDLREIEIRVKEDLARIKAKIKADRMIAQASLSTHPYLVSKGFPEHKAWVQGENLILPIREPNGEISNVQIIWPDGERGFDSRFLADGKISGCFLRLGTGTEEFWIVEGYATGLSVRAALDQLDRRQDFCVVVAFSAHNMPNVAEALGEGPDRYVVANHDQKGTGKKYARKTDWPWWIPETPGQDANDLHQAEGLEALAGSLRDWLSKQPGNQ